MDSSGGHLPAVVGAASEWPPVVGSEAVAPPHKQRSRILGSIVLGAHVAGASEIGVTSGRVPNLAQPVSENLILVYNTYHIIPFT